METAWNRAETLLKAGSTTINPTTNSRWTLIESDAETGGMGFTLEVVCREGAPPDVLEHVHGTWTESFEIVSGSARYRAGGVEKAAEAGETVDLPPGQPHVHPWNAGEGELVYRQIARFPEASPAAVQEVIGVFFTLFGMAGEGRLNAKGLPKNPLQFAATLRALVRHQGYDAAVPVAAQKALAATFGRLAEALGYRAVQPERFGGPAE